MSTNLSQMYDRLASFDTETTGLNVSKSNIWQLGFTSSSTSIESEVNPFLLFDAKKNTWKSSRKFNNAAAYTQALRTSNGEFSEMSYNSGAFKNNIKQFSKKALNNIDQGFKNTIGQITGNDILVMQNHKFENRLLLDKRIKGLISEDAYTSVQDNFKYLSTTDNGLFNTPTKVQQVLREAEFKRYTTLESNPNIKKRHISSYTDKMNEVIDAYKFEMDNSLGKTIVVEQMDITKALYANAINSGLMRPEHSNIGLSIDFLTQTLYGYKEKHTALSDSKDTLKVFKDTWSMIDELRTGNISTDTKTKLKNISNAQSGEVLTQFNKTISSVLNDFNTRGNTSSGFHRASSELIDMTSGVIDTVQEISVGSERYTSDFNKAMDTVVSRYNFSDRNREMSAYVESLKTMHSNNNSFDSISSSHATSVSLGADQFNKIKIPKGGVKLDNIPVAEKMPRSLKLGAIAAVGLGYMAMKDSPDNPQTNSYVSQEFYDDQHLGTVFLESEDRNKHYIY